MKLSIIIISWNTRELTLKCLKSIFQYTKDVNFEVFVVDNNSSDGTVEEVENFKQENSLDNLIIIKNRENLGFAKANNQAIKKAQGEFILLLNPDTEILNNALYKMVEFMRRYPECGVAGCKLLNSDMTLQPSVRMFPDLAVISMINLKLHYLIPLAKVLARYLMHDFNYEKTQEVEQVMGAFFMIRRKVIEEIGLLDENYFIWGEEVDFCQRVIKSGRWKVYYTPQAQIIHYGGQSFKQVLPVKKQLIWNHSLLHYFAKHKPKWQWLILWMLQPVSLLLALINQLVGVKNILQKKKDI